MTNTKQSKNQQAASAYAEKVSQIDALLKRLQAASDDNFAANAEKLNWGDVGLVNDIECKLRQISDMVFKEGEHAPENN